jgi:phenylalanyl-tRNA synthetase alpha subunit
VNKPRKDHNVKGGKYDVAIKPKKVRRNRSHLIMDVVQESQKKYRESKTIEIDPEYIIEEQKKRQPLSFQE